MEATEFQTIYDTFANTEYGRQLEASIRFEKYNLGNLSHEEWCELLGADANNLHHMWETYILAQRFIESQNKSDKPSINARSTELQLLSAIMHDQAEYFAGDISYSDKTASDEKYEITVFEQNLDAMNPGMDAATKSMARSAIRGVIFDSSTKEGTLFNAIERTGYLTTAIHAAGQLPTVTNPATAEGIHWLVTDVLLNQIPTLVEYTQTYSYPDELLTQNAELISAVFAHTTDDVFHHYKDKGPQKKQDFIKAQQAWATFCSSHSL